VTASRRSITVGSVSEYQWKASLTGLAADTAYCYRVFLGATDLLGTDASPVFRSQVGTGSSTPFSFAVFGDWGEVDASGSNPDQANLMAQVASSGVRFAITTGDTGYPGGTETTYGDLQQVGADTSAIFGRDFWARAGDSIPLFNATGNHGFNSVGLNNWPQDVAVSSSSGRYLTETYCCTNGTTSGSYPSAWYAFNAGNARFYVLEAAWSSVNNGTATQYQNDYDNHWTVSSPEYQWLKQDLEAHPGGLKFAFWHYPMYSDNATETSSPFLQGAGSLEGLLARNEVSIGFNGHAHVYERNVKPTGGIVTYLTGGGGAKLEPIGATGCSSFDAYAIGWSYSANRGSACGSAPVPSSISQVFHFLKVTVDGSTVTVAPTDSLGRTFDVKTYNFDTSGSESTATFRPSDDTYVQQSSPGTTKGTATTIQVDGSPVKDTLLKFSVTGSDGRAVTSAKLRLYTTDASPSAGSVYATASSTWSESTANWSNAPATSGSALRSLGAVTAGTWDEADITPAVTGDGVISLRLKSTSTNGANFASKEAGAATAPQLVVTYSGTGTGDTQPPSAPGNLGASAAVDASRVDLTWTASTDNVAVTAYDVYRNGAASPLTSVNGSITAYSDTTVAPATTYSYVLKARDAVGNVSQPSNTATVTTTSPPGNPPAVPTGLQASAGDGSVALSWNASSGATSYNLKRSTSPSGPFSTIASPATTSAADSGVTNGTTYYYVVSAVNADGESADSAPPVSATPQAAPPPSAAVFTDDFESGNLSKWTSSGGLVAQGSLVHGGSFAVRGNTTTGRTYAKKTLPATYTDGYARIYFYLASGYASQVNLLRFRAAADASLGYLYVSTAGTLGLRDDAGAVTKLSGTGVAADAWHALELHVTIAGTASSTEVWLDGTRITDLSLTGQNWGSNPIAAFQIGEVQTGRTYDVTFDDVAFGTGRIGP
jgi:hypothetical protein